MNDLEQQMSDFPELNQSHVDKLLRLDVSSSSSSSSEIPKLRHGSTGLRRSARPMTLAQDDIPDEGKFLQSNTSQATSSASLPKSNSTSSSTGSKSPIVAKRSRDTTPTSSPVLKKMPQQPFVPKEKEDIAHVHLRASGLKKSTRPMTLARDNHDDVDDDDPLPSVKSTSVLQSKPSRSPPQPKKSISTSVVQSQDSIPVLRRSLKQSARPMTMAREESDRNLDMKMQTPSTPSHAKQPVQPKKEAPSSPSIMKKEAPSSPSIMKKEAPSSSSIMKKDVPSSSSIMKKDVPSSPSIMKKDVPSSPSIMKKDAPSSPSIMKKESPSSTQSDIKVHNTDVQVRRRPVPKETSESPSSPMFRAKLKKSTRPLTMAIEDPEQAALAAQQSEEAKKKAHDLQEKAREERQARQKEALAALEKLSESNSEGNKPLSVQEKEEKRKQDAIKWVDKEIRKLISQIQALGSLNAEGRPQVKFGLLFEETANIFEALSGTLKTAQKRGVVAYKGDLLLQRVHDEIIITLLQDEIEDGSAETYQRKHTVTDSFEKSKQKRADKAFGEGSLQMQMLPCSVCNKTVYPAEFVGASDKAFHKTCFICCVCKRPLKQNDYYNMNDHFYCGPHYNQTVKSNVL